MIFRTIPAWCAIPIFMLPITCGLATAQQSQRAAVPRTADGKPNLQGIWQAAARASFDLQDQAARQGMPAGKGVVQGGEIPYQPWAAATKQQNFANRQSAGPAGK